MSTDHRIEPLAREVSAQLCPHLKWDDLSLVSQVNYRCVAVYLLDREAKRVGPLVEAAERLLLDAKRYELSYTVSHHALRAVERSFAAYRALDAPPAPEPSLAEAVEAMLAARDNFGCVMDPKAVAAVRAALDREREKAQP